MLTREYEPRNACEADDGMTELQHADLDLADADDRAIYRQRVGREYAMMKLEAVRRESGLPLTASRVDATNAIANRRIAELARDAVPGPR